MFGVPVCVWRFPRRKGHPRPSLVSMLRWENTGEEPKTIEFGV